MISSDPGEGRRLFVEALGLGLAGADPAADPSGEYLFSERVAGAKHFGVWPLWQAAEACFGTREWPADRAVPQASVEFDVPDADAVTAAEHELVERGFDLLHGTRTEPWGQTVVRLQTSDGLIVGVSHAPWMHE